MHDDNSHKKKTNVEKAESSNVDKSKEQDPIENAPLKIEANANNKDFISELIDKSLFDSQWFQEENWSLMKDPNAKNNPEQFSFFVGGDSDGDGCSSGGDAGDSGGGCKGCVGDSGA